MRTLVYLTAFFARKRLMSGVGVLVVILAMLLVLTGFLAAVRWIEQVGERYGQLYEGRATSQPVVDVERGSIHTQVWEATDFVYLQRYPMIAGTLLPLRMAVPWLLIMLPFLGMLLSVCDVSRELETGVAQTLYGTPVRRWVLGTSRVLGDSFVALALTGIGILAALGVGSVFVRYEIGAGQLARSAALILILGAYTSIFVQVGTLLSARARRSTNAIWGAVVIGLAVVGVYAAGENVMNAAHAPYATLPSPPYSVDRLLSEHVMTAMSGTGSLERFEETGGPELARYVLELNAHADAFHRTLHSDYQRERWYAFLSPAHAIWEIAGQLLQDRHVDATEILAPVAPLDVPPSIGTSLRRVWPELVGMLVAWLGLFGMNVHALSRLEV